VVVPPDDVVRPDHPETFGATGVLAHFRGPFADGPPPRALEVHAPPLDTFGFAELRRMVVIYVVLVVSIVSALARRAVHPRSSTTWLSAASEGAVDGFERLGPTFVKLGQVVASSPGLFPSWLSDACLRCLNEVAPFDGATACRLVEQDLGRPPTQIFRQFDERAISAASIGQVHACVLPDGRDAVIKLQRPAIAHRMNTDLRIMARLARQLERTKLGRTLNASGAIVDLHTVANQELNFALEAYRQSQFRTNIGYYGDNAHITAPEVYWEYCGPHLICMERMSGIPLDQHATIVERGIDGELVLRRGIKVWLEALVHHGPFHGDVHAGNLWVLDDGRASYLDFGIMGELTDEWKDVFKDLFYTSMIDSDFVRVVRAYKRVGILPTDADETMMAGLIGAQFAPMLDQTIGSVSLGETFTSTIKLVEQLGMTQPQELMLIGKQLLYFERYAKMLAPDYTLARDIFLVKNIFPDAVAKRVADLGITLPD